MKRSFGVIVLVMLALMLAACGGGDTAPVDTPAPAPTMTPVPPADTPAPTAEPPPATAEPAPEAEPVAAAAVEIPGEAAHAVDLVAAWTEAGAPDADPFDYVGYDGATYQATFAADIQPLFTKENIWFQGAPSCMSCHHDNLENAYHEMDLSTHEGIMAGGDRLSEPPGVPLLGQSEIGATDYDWEHGKIKERLRDNRMPPGMPFDITEANRDGPPVDVGGTEVMAVDLIAAWVEAGAPETDAFGDYERDLRGQRTAPLHRAWAVVRRRTVVQQLPPRQPGERLPRDGPEQLRGDHGRRRPPVRAARRAAVGPERDQRDRL